MPLIFIIKGAFYLLFRYADDIVILSSSKEFLHNIIYKIQEYLDTNLRLQVKTN